MIRINYVEGGETLAQKRRNNQKKLQHNFDNPLAIAQSISKPTQQVNQTAKNKRKSTKHRGVFELINLDFDKPFFILILVLLVFGTVMMFSASYAWALSENGDGYIYVKKQAIIAGVGIIAMLAISVVDYHVMQRTKIAVSIFIGSLGLLIYTSFFGISHHGARRWISIGGMEFQPSEIMKFAVVVFFAYIISINYNKMKDWRYGVLPFGIVLGIISIFMMVQRHLSGTLLICSIGFIMIFVGGAKLKSFLIAGAGMVGLVTVFIIIKMATGNLHYVSDRIESWRNPFGDISDKTWQTCQSLIAIGSGGLFGMGFGESRQKYLYLPESKNDFIFAIVCEELGLIGAMLVILLFALFIMRGFYIASKARDKFGMMLVVGLTIQIGIQALLNIAVVTNSVPNTGISLPFFSYGGTALAMQLAEMGIILNVSRQANIEE